LLRGYEINILPIVNAGSPTRAAARANESVNELLNVRCPVLDPFAFATDSEGASSAFPFECTDFIRAHAFRKPYGSRGRNFFCQALVQKDFASYSMGDGTTKAAKRNVWICKISEPDFALGVRQSNSWGRFERAIGSDHAVCLSLIERRDEQGRQNLDA